MGRFSQSQGVSTASFHAWKRRLASDSPGTASLPARESAFVPVILAATPEPQPRDSAEFLTVRHPDGGRILLPIAAGGEFVCRVVETVARIAARRENKQFGTFPNLDLACAI
ncbi:IS66 family insertion sequence element accessory protein TnpA [Singulisphaera sp. Ch08]|uniref:IS66 family insertion sequence element accessory protein TnpA n=1 Tax=Singulisphaera sp. Ch08 TaxID=3120278 RepID=UPI003873968F